MLTLLALLLIGPAAAATTTDSIHETGNSRSGAVDAACMSTTGETATATYSLELPDEQLAELRNVELVVEARHAECPVYIDSVTFRINGTAYYTKRLALTGSKASTAAWRVSDVLELPDQDIALDKGTNLVTAVLSGRVTDGDTMLRVTLAAGLEYGRDWDGDAYVSSMLTGGDDCDDHDATVYPAALEGVGDGVDQDCDGHELCFLDDDEDGYHVGTTVDSPDLDCDDVGEAWGDELMGDCDDGDPATYPGATEIVGDEVDQSCDGKELCFRDNDGDGVRTNNQVASPDTDCVDSGEAVADLPSGDCDDADDQVHPGATQIVADGIDQTCEGGELCYADRDEDGWRTDETVHSSDLTCDGPGEAGTDAPFADCDDRDPDVRGGGPDILNGLDDDCDETVDTDSDSDGVLDWYETSSGTDSDDPDSDADGRTDGEEWGNLLTHEGQLYPVDSDGDGLIDALDEDSDDDGLADAVEVDADWDGDGIENYRDDDDDGDGIPTWVEAAGDPTVDSDGDGVPDYLDVDSDNDGATDGSEGVGDLDGDGVPDYLDNASDAGDHREPNAPERYGFGLGCSSTPVAPVSSLGLIALLLVRARRRQGQPTRPERILRP